MVFTMIQAALSSSHRLDDRSQLILASITASKPANDTPLIDFQPVITKIHAWLSASGRDGCRLI